MIKLGNAPAADRCGYESGRPGWQSEINYNEGAVKEWKGWRDKQSDDFKARGEADLAEQDAPDGQQQEGRATACRRRRASRNLRKASVRAPLGRTPSVARTRLAELGVIEDGTLRGRYHSKSDASSPNVSAQKSWDL